MTHGSYLARDDSSCVFFGEGYYKKLKSLLPFYEDLTPLPDNLDTGYLKELSCKEFAKMPEKLKVMELFQEEPSSEKAVF